MRDRAHLERILKINGISRSASEADIRSVLLASHFTEREVEVALTVLQSNGTEQFMRSDSMNKLVRTDKNLTANEISKLLGIEIAVSSTQTSPQRKSSPALINSQRVAVATLSVVIAFIGIGLAMYLLEFGVFHATAAILPYEW